MKITYFVDLNEKERNVKIKKTAVTLFLFAITVTLSGFMSSYITEYVRDGLKLCANTIVGSVFPFLILTDVIVAFSSFDTIGYLRTIFEKAFKVNGYAVTAYAIGLLCGFPLGVKVSVDLYRDGYISKDECERLIGFSNNTGPAFIIAGVGFGLRGSIRDGVILYFSMLISSLISGVITGIGKDFTKTERKGSCKIYNFTASVKNAATNTLNICAFVVFFSVISGIISIFIKNEILYSLILTISEVSNATKMLAKSNLSSKVSLIISSFAISFSGISVHMQAKSFLLGTNLSMRCYFITKAMQGVLSSIITWLFVLLVF